MESFHWLTERLARKSTQNKTTQQRSKLSFNSAVTTPKKKSLSQRFRGSISRLLQKDGPSKSEQTTPRSGIDPAVSQPPPPINKISTEPIVHDTLSLKAQSIITVHKAEANVPESTDKSAAKSPSAETSVAEPSIAGPSTNETSTVEQTSTAESSVADIFITTPPPTGEKFASEKFADEMLVAEHSFPTPPKEENTYPEEIMVDQQPEFDPVWGRVEFIPSQAIEKLAMEHAPPHAEAAHSLGARAGLNNRVFLIEYEPTNEKRCIRVPASGWEGKWSETDKFQLTRSNNIMKYLKTHTTIPIPEVFHWDTELDNAIGAPYTIMAAADGISPLDLWFRGVLNGYDEDEDETEHEDDEECQVEKSENQEDKDKQVDDDDEEDDEISNGDPNGLQFHLGFNYRKVSPKLEQKRQNLLKSLALSVAELRHLKFDQLGSLSFPNGPDGAPEVVPYNNLCYGRFARDSKDPTSHGGRTYRATISLLTASVRNFRRDVERTADPEDEDLWAGLSCLYWTAIARLPILMDHRCTKETFVLAPPDFGSQNILCDEDGNITAILDWDVVDTMPHIIGWSDAPDWLSVDWFGEDCYSWPNGCMTPEDLKTYLHDYARYMRDACKDTPDVDDWKYTTKSPIYEALYQGLIYQDKFKMLDTMKSMLATFLPRLNHKELIRQIGKGYKNREDEMGREMWSYIYAQFHKLFEPEEIMEKAEPTSRDAEAITVESGDSISKPESMERESTVVVSTSEDTQEPSPTLVDEKGINSDMVEHSLKKRFSGVTITELLEMPPEIGARIGDFLIRPVSSKQVRRSSFS
jgi:hypothetical protein